MHAVNFDLHVVDDFSQKWKIYNTFIASML